MKLKTKPDGKLLPVSKPANIHSLAAIRPCGGVGGGDKGMCD
jgi:hypothetical protein